MTTSSLADIRAHVATAIRTLCPDAPPRLVSSVRLAEDLGIASLKTAMILMSAAEASGIELAELEFGPVKTVGDIVEALARTRRAEVPTQKKPR